MTQDRKALVELRRECERTLPAMEAAYQKGGAFLLTVGARIIRDLLAALSAEIPREPLTDTYRVEIHYNDLHLRKFLPKADRSAWIALARVMMQEMDAALSDQPKEKA